VLVVGLTSELPVLETSAGVVAATAAFSVSAMLDSCEARVA
jgi:hypothetical protein